ncbi:MAG: ATP-dependent helicase, partial [Bacteroidaceae bacterium]|nr:ATP-dependent helicase [Bacteroidaceae bacterium]MCF0185596.1 ATP-dependent helicase [Bacteroidaceae bacterium]
RTRKQILDLFNRHRIIVGTVASISGQLNALSQLKRFDVAIIDEASQILEPHLLGILSAKTKQGDCAIRKFIMIGDHKQLPAVVIQRQTHSQVYDERLQSIGLADCRNSLFERLYSWQLTHPTSNISSTLLKQGRMHPDVCEFVNRHFYHGDLQTVPVPHQLQPLDFPNHGRDLQEYIATRRVGFLHCDCPETMEVSNKHNRKEAKIVASIVGTINELCLMNGLEFNPAERIGIIVPFRGQISMIRKEIEKLPIENANQIVVDTVERFQGSQRDIIIFSTTISQPYQLNILSAPVEIEGLMVDRKLNVALTRAKKQLFVVGNANLLSRHPLYKALIDAFSC